MNNNAFPDLTRFDQWDFSAVQSAVVTITPEFAAQMLQKNFSTNRKIAPAVVTRYSRDMKEGAWHLGDPISFCTDGKLVNGQHRLKAVIHSATPTDFIVATGLPSSSYLAFDQGVRRTASHLLTIGGGIEAIPVADRDISIYRSMVSMLSVSQPVAGLKVRIKDVQDLLPTVFDGILFAKKHGGQLRSPVIAVVARAYYTCPSDKLSRFLDLVSDPYQPCTANETFATRLKFVLSDKCDNSGSTSRAIMSAYTQTALSRYLKGDEWKKGCSFQPVRRVIFECPLDVAIAEKLNISVSDLIKKSATGSVQKIVKSEQSDGSICYATVHQMTQDLLGVTVKDVTRSTIEEVIQQGGSYVRSSIKAIVEELYPSLAGVKCGATSVQPGSASIASNLMQQVDRLEWAHVFPTVSIVRQHHKPLLLVVGKD